MHHDTSHIREVFLYVVFDLMRDQVTFANRLFSIHEKMEFDDTIESAFSSNATIHIFDTRILTDDGPDTVLEFRILDLIEELADRRPTDVIDIVTHEQSSDEGRPVSC